MSERNHLSAGALALALCGALPGSAAAMSYVMMSDEALLEQSQGVAKFEVVRALPVADGDQETRYLLRTQATLAGRTVHAYETLALPGTFDAPNVNLVVHGVPKLNAGSTVLLFHSRRPDGVLGAQQLSLGLFAETETTRGDKLYVRFLNGEDDRGAGKNKRYSKARSVAGFDAWLRERGRGQQPAVNYLVDMPAGSEKFTFSPFGFPQPGPGRWFQFDSDQTLPWTARPDGQTGMVTDEFAQLQQALAAWTNDAGSRILMSYTGTAAAASAAQLSGHVKWNDPDSQITGSFNCGTGGVLAIGGSSAFSNGQTFAGQTWYPRAFAFVTVQDNAGCVMDDDNGASGAELLLHEVGHAIAFGHSCGDSESPACNTSATLDDAVMRAFLHGDGRGASVRADDAAGAAVVYPAPGGGGGVTVIFRDGYE